MLRGFPRCVKNHSVPPAAAPNRLLVGMLRGHRAGWGRRSHGWKDNTLMGLLVGVAAGYVLGTRAGRARYEQLSKTAKAVAASPVTKKAIEVGRQKLADSLSPQPKLEPMKPIDETTTIMIPRDQLKK